MNISTYPTVELHGQIWLAKNLSVSTFSNGDTIFQAIDQEGWTYAADNRIPAWTYFDFREAYYADEFEIKFYNWHAVNDPRGLAPDGWRVPTAEDWEHLLKHYIISEEKTAELKSNVYPGEGDSDQKPSVSGFDAILSGYCSDHGGCANYGYSASWWIADSYNDEEAWIIYYAPYNQIQKIENVKGMGLSVRLIKE